MPRDLFRLCADIGERLRQRREWLATAESCTGGWIAKQLTDIPGSSAWFDRGLVTYANRAKTGLLGVDDRILDVDGAVSEACVTAMVEGLLHHSGVDWGIAVTGVAGPGGGSEEKPVGTVWIGWQLRGQTAQAGRYHFDGDREAVRRQTVERALEGLLERLDAPQPSEQH